MRRRVGESPLRPRIEGGIRIAGWRLSRCRAIAKLETGQLEKPTRQGHRDERGGIEGRESLLAGHWSLAAAAVRPPAVVRFGVPARYSGFAGAHSPDPDCPRCRHCLSNSDCR